MNTLGLFLLAMLLPIPAAAMVSHQDPDVVQLLQAARDNNMPVIETILGSRPALVNCTNETGHTPLHEAARQGHTEAVSFLVCKGANVEAQIPTTESRPLHCAILSEKAATAWCLVTQGNADVNAQKKDGETALNLAARHDQPKMVCMLIGYRAAINRASYEKHMTPLHTAARYRHGYIAELLIEYKADKEAKTKDGKTPYDIAAENDATSTDWRKSLTARLKPQKSTWHTTPVLPPISPTVTSIHLNDVKPPVSFNHVKPPALSRSPRSPKQPRPLGTSPAHRMNKSNLSVQQPTTTKK